MRWFNRSLFLDDTAPAGGGAAVVEPAAGTDRPGAGALLGMTAAIAAARERLSDDGTTMHAQPGEQPPPLPIADPIPPVVDPAAPPADPAAPPADPAQAAAPEEPAPVDPAAIPEASPVTVVLPGLRNGEQPIEIDFPDQESADRVRAAMNDGMRADELRRQVGKVDAQRQELDYIEDMIRVDPVGFVVERMPTNVRLELAMTILAEDGALEQVRPMLDKWAENDDARKIDRLEAANVRVQSRSKIDENVSVMRQQRAAVHAVTSTVDAMSSLVAPELQDQFVLDTLADMQSYAAQNPRVGRLQAPQIVKLLETRLRVYGLKPADALAAIQSPPTRGLPTAQPKGEAAQKIAAQVAAARQTGEDLRSRAAVRRAAASVPSPGAGGAPPATVLPKETMQARIDRVRQLHPR